MILSPDAVVSILILVLVYCSATRGEMLDLNAPVPIPMTIIAIEKQARDP